MVKTRAGHVQSSQTSTKASGNNLQNDNAPGSEPRRPRTRKKKQSRAQRRTIDLGVKRGLKVVTTAFDDLKIQQVHTVTMRPDPVLKKLKARARRESLGDKTKAKKPYNQWDVIMAGRGLRNYYLDMVDWVEVNAKVLKQSKKLISVRPAQYKYANVYKIPSQTFNRMIHKVEEIRLISNVDFPWTEKQFGEFVDLFRGNLLPSPEPSDRGT